jgi:homoserine O-acetyltransferase
MFTLQPSTEGDCTFAVDEPFRLEGGGELQPVTIRYSTYGELNYARDNAVLVCHALSGSARVADWWAELFATGVLDPSVDCVIGTNVLGSCYGSTGPSSINQKNGEPYGPDFPLVTIADMVRAQARVIDHLGIRRLRAVMGGSIGGMQALRWAVDFPDRVQHCITVGTAPLGAMGLALNHLQRRAIQIDPLFNGGRYTAQPADGLALARAIAMCSYKSAELFEERFARKPNRNGEDPLRSLADRFDVGGYLDHQGEKFVARFDANSYLVLSRAMDTFDLAQGYPTEAAALARITADVLLVGISSDWLFPAADVRSLASRMLAAAVRCRYAELESQHGHDGFLADADLLAPILRDAVHRPSSPEIDPAPLVRAANIQEESWSK